MLPDNYNIALNKIIKATGSKCERCGLTAINELRIVRRDLSNHRPLYVVHMQIEQHPEQYTVVCRTCAPLNDDEREAVVERPSMLDRLMSWLGLDV